MIKNAYILVLIFLSNIILNEFGLTQNFNSKAYENIFFTLDFQKNKYDLEEIKKYFFTTFPHDDPTQGDVVYDRKRWINEGMITISDYDGLYVFIKSRNDSLGFDSFRLTSKTFYNLNNKTQKILFVFKGKIPSELGLWPAWWLNGSLQDEWIYNKNYQTISDELLDTFSGKGKFYETPSPVNCTDWPAGGEVDIIETINGRNLIYNTIHSCPQMCDSKWNDDEIMVNCANSTQTDPNSGCSGKPYEVKSPEGTFACLWEESMFSFYYWEPEVDVRKSGGPLSNSPEPNVWQPFLKNQVKLFSGSVKCNELNHQEWQCKNCNGINTCEFKNLKMIFNITVCGKWAGSEFDETTNSLSNCKNYVKGVGKEAINNKFIKVEYLSVRGLN